MVFHSRVGNVLRQTASKQINSETASTPSKLFVGGVSVNYVIDRHPNFGGAPGTGLRNYGGGNNNTYGRVAGSGYSSAYVGGCNSNFGGNPSSAPAAGSGFQSGYAATFVDGHGSRTGGYDIRYESSWGEILATRVRGVKILTMRGHGVKTLAVLAQSENTRCASSCGWK